MISLVHAFSFYPAIFVVMAIFRLPKTIRWIVVCAILLLILLTAYRYCINLLFPNLFAGIKTGLGNAFWYGLRFDVRIVGGLTLLMFLLSFYPGKHYFRSEEGKKVALWVYGFFITMILVFYAADIAYLRNFNQRLNSSIISDLAKNTEKGIVFKTKTEWLAITGTMIAVIVFFILLANKLHGFITNMKGSGNTGKRITWQVITIIVCVLAMYGSFTLKPLSVSTAASRLTAAQLALALNPFEALFNTLPERRTGSQ
ncbi:hypothetical protein BH10BAC3_BH10BAC3_26400 [soil metagenome]